MIELSTPLPMWLIGPIRPMVAMTAVSARSSGTDGRHHRSEGDQQDHQRDGQRGDQRLLEVVGDHILDLLSGAGVAELPDGEPRVRRLNRRDLVEGRAHAILDLGVVARDLEAQQGGAAVTRDVPAILRRVGVLDCLNVGRGRKPSLRCRRPWPGTTGRWPARCRSGRAPSRPHASARRPSSALSARPDSPTPESEVSSALVPTALPIANARNTNASQPQIASLRCWALHTPARAATPFGRQPMPPAGSCASRRWKRDIW